MANINIYGELYNDTPNGYVAPATQIKDVDLGKTQDQINAELAASGSASEANTGYVVCGTAAATAAKEINDTTTLAGFVLDNNIRLLVKMTYANTAENPTLNINDTGAKAINYNGTVASSTNTWADNEVVDIYYDGSNYVVATHGEAQFSTGEKVREVKIVNNLITDNEHDVLSAKQGTVILEYLHNLEIAGSSILMGIAQSLTIPYQPTDTRVSYIAAIGQGQSVTFTNFLKENNTPIQITAQSNESFFVVLVWNTQYWEYESINANIISVVVQQEKGQSTTDTMSQKTITNILNKDENLADEAYKYLTIEFDCSNVVTGKCLRPNGDTLNVANGAYCQDYFPVNSGMKIMYQASGYGTVAAILCYDSNKSLISETYLQISPDANYREWTIPEGVSYIRISTERYTTYGLGCYIKATKTLKDARELDNRVSNLEKYHTNDDVYRLNTDENFYISDTNINPFDLNYPTYLPKFKPTTPRIEFKYKGQLNNEKRYATLGFDDFRVSDFAYMIPMLNKYDARAEFNLIKRGIINSGESFEREKLNVNQCALLGQEIGDHTFMHEKFPFSDPMWNGQDPASLDGTQTPYPSNDQMRVDVGNGKNYFGMSLSDKPISDIKYQGQSITHTWANLTDDECQAIRNWYSLFGDINDTTIGETGHSNLLPYLDELSNKYLGTTGSSKGSWVNVEGETNGGHYTGGIYTGMHSSANEEIWERYMQLVDIYTKDLYGYNGRIRTWSMPGSKSSLDAYFFFYGTEVINSKFYDIDRTIPINYNSRWESATLKNPDGTPKVRSFTELLREFGYVATHDYEVPGRNDELGYNAYQIKFFPNADLSQINGVGRLNNYELYNNNPASTITNASWFTQGKQRETDMYDRIQWFRGAIEIFRNYTGGGRFAGLVADTTNVLANIYGYMSVFEGLVRYCTAVGIELITTQEAYDVAFNHRLDDGNLIYNPYLRNTAKEFLKGESENTHYQVSDNPDGYYGSCTTEKDTDDCNVNVLVTSGNVKYEHWGIPYGHLKYSADIKGEGTISIYEFKNKTALETWNPQGTSISAKRINLSDCGSPIATKTVSSASDYTEQKIEFNINNNDFEAWNNRTETMGDKVIGVVVVYSSGLRVKNIRLQKVK